VQVDDGTGFKSIPGSITKAAEGNGIDTESDGWVPATSTCRRQGEILPIDSHPQPIYKLDGLPWRGRIQTYDAPFSLEKAASFTLHDQNTGALPARAQAPSRCEVGTTPHDAGHDRHDTDARREPAAPPPRDEVVGLGR
jgi:hypothetical protein